MQITVDATNSALRLRFAKMIIRAVALPPTVTHHNQLLWFQFDKYYSDCYQ
uniref:Uncharacterized protein n=1 Tax=Solanum tuberosum TaxID=4113 RepID=M1ANC3_SOLTU